MDYNIYNLVNIRENTFKLKKFDEWINSSYCKIVTEDIVEEGKLLDQCWSAFVPDLYTVQWNETDMKYCISKINENFQVKFIDDV